MFKAIRQHRAVKMLQKGDILQQLNAIKRLRAMRAVEPLIRVLQDERFMLSWDAAEALGEIGDARAVEALIAALREKMPQAAEALGKIGDARAVEPLIAVLQSERADLRKTAMQALGRIGDARAIEPVVVLLQDRNKEVRTAAANALTSLHWQPTDQRQQAHYLMTRQQWEEVVQLGAVAVEPLVAVLQNGDSTTRASAAEVLGKIKDPRAFEPLVASLHDWDKQVRQVAALALGEMGDARAVEPLVAVLQDEDAKMRQAAVQALGRLGDGRAIEPLLLALQEQDEGVRKQANRAISAIKDQRAIGPLVAALEHEDKEVRLVAARALSHLDWQAEDALQRTRYLLARQQWDQLGNQSESQTEPLVAALQDQDWQVRQGAAQTLALLGWQPATKVQQIQFLMAAGHWDEVASFGAAAVKPLAAALRDKRSEVREAAAQALGKIGGTQVVASLIYALHDREWQVQLAVQEALVHIGPPAVRLLVAALQQGNTNVASLLGRMGDPRALAPLIARANSAASSFSEKQEALGALTLILRQSTSQVTREDLHTLATLKVVHEKIHHLPAMDNWAEDYVTEEQPLDCTKVQQLANQELLRRTREV